MKIRVKKEWLGIAVLLIVISLLYFMMDGPKAEELALKTPLENGKDYTQTEEPVMIKVYITGEVMTPGVYELKSQDRLEVLLTLAGGFTKEANTTVNLARKLVDGEMIVVYVDIGEVVIEEHLSEERLLESHYIGIDLLNYGTKEEILVINGIGEVIAKRILDYRTEKGFFNDYKDLLNIEGIGEQKLKTIQLEINQ